MNDSRDRQAVVVEKGFYVRKVVPVLSPGLFASGEMLSDLRSEVFLEALAANNESPVRSAIFLDGTISPPGAIQGVPYKQPQPLPGILIAIQVTCKEAVTPDLKFLFVDYYNHDFQADPQEIPVLDDPSSQNNYIGEPIIIAAADYSTIGQSRIALVDGLSIPIPDVQALAIGVIANGAFTLGISSGLIFRFYFLL